MTTLFSLRDTFSRQFSDAAGSFLSRLRPGRKPWRPGPVLLSALLCLSLPGLLSAGELPGKSQQLTSPDQVPEGLAKSDWTSIWEAYEAGRHAFQPVKGGAWQAQNKAQQWSTQFDGRGFMAKPKAADWQWGLKLRSYGFGNKQTAVGGQPAVKAEGQRLSYQWDSDVQEWFINDQRGLEHGFNVARRPQGAAAKASLDMVLGTRGTLKASVAADTQTVYFRDGAGAPVVTYAGLKVWDADGKVLPSRFVAGPSGGIILRVDESSARYPITIDPIAQQAYLKASQVSASDLFGVSVAVSGDTVVVGARFEDSSTTGVNSTPNETGTDSGAAYVFVRSGSTWSQQAYLKPNAVGTTQAGDNFGFSVAVSGDTVVVGADSEDSSTTGINSTPNDDAGAVNAGAAYVFVRSGGTWSQQAYLKASEVTTLDNFGVSVAVSGDTVVVGATGEGSSTTGINSTPNNSVGGAGAAYVFVRSGSTWSQQAYLKASQVTTLDNFGWSVDVSEDTVVVGARYEDSSTTGINSTPNDSADSAGAAYVFVRSGSTWSQQAYLKPNAVGTTQAGDQFGWAVAVSGDTVVVGADFEDSSTTGINSTSNEALGATGNAGAAYVFVRSSGTWSQQAYLKPNAVGTTQAGDQFGHSVDVSGDTVVVGGVFEDSSTTGINSSPNEDAGGAGAAYVFVRSGSTWSQQAYLKASQVTAADQFGRSVAVSGDTVVVGANREDSSTTGVNSTPNEGAESAGAAYVFTGLGTMGKWAQTYFGSSTVNVGNEEDFDSDGVINLLEFAFGTLPNNNASGSASLQYTGTFAGAGTLTSNGQPGTGFEPISMGIDFRALFVRRKDYAASGLTYTPQFSANLSTWQDSAAVPTVLADDGTYQIVSVPYPPFIAGKKARFFRISVTKAQ